MTHSGMWRSIGGACSRCGAHSSHSKARRVRGSLFRQRFSHPSLRSRAGMSLAHGNREGPALGMPSGRFF